MQIHTPDSSRYWLADSYAARHADGLEPMSVDKEFLRLWFREHCDPYKDEVCTTLCTGWNASVMHAFVSAGMCGKQDAQVHCGP